jgi:hypothetical protein
VSEAAHPLVDRYLHDLGEALHEMPGRHRDRLVTGVAGQIDEMLPTHPSEADVQAVLNRLGDPRQVAASERLVLGIKKPKPGWFEWLTIALLLIGGVFSLLGWVAGLVFLWLSWTWPLRDKVVATLLVPGGLLPATSLFLTQFRSGQNCTDQVVLDSIGHTTLVAHCTGSHTTGTEIGLLVSIALLVIAPTYTAVRLGLHLIRMRRRLSAEHSPA